MKPLSSTCSLALTLLLGSLGLVGCGGALSFPDAVVSSQVQGPPVQGTVYGGHAAIVGAHVYLLQPGTSGYGSAATSLLTGTSAGGYALTANVNDPNVPVGAKYETSDASGGFNLTGGYTCTVGQPVYLYSYGTSAYTVTSKSGSTTTSTVTETITGITVSGATADTNGNATYAITVSAALPLTAGQTVTIAGLTGNLAVLNGARAALAATAGTTFSVSATDVYGTYTYYTGLLNPRRHTYYDTVGNGAYTATSGQAGNDGGGNDNGNANFDSESGDTSTGTGPFGSGGTAAATETTTTSPTPTTNPSLELATLGVCPSSGNFSTAGNGALTYVYMNEVSTVATAYTFQPFTVASNNNAWDIGSSGSTQALVGIANAAETAAQLYDIEGASLISSTHDGEGHLANYQTQLTSVVNGQIVTSPNEGNGAVPQATIDTLANILAACIDSTPGGAGNNVLSSQCTTLFNTATDNGQTLAAGDTAPTDTATAAINIARYPAGNNSGTADPTYVSDIFGIPTGTVPYAPNLAHAPNDWTIAINYPTSAVSGTTAANTTLGLAESIAVDDIGQIWITGQTDYDMVRWSPLGVQDAYHSSSTNTSGATNYIYGYVSIDGSNNAWAGNANSSTGIEEFDSNGVLYDTYGSGYNKAYTVVTNNAGDAFFIASTSSTGGNYEMFEYGPNGTPLTEHVISPSVISAGNNVAHGAIDSVGDIWLTTEASPYQIARVTQTGTSAFAAGTTSITTPQQPEFPAIDSAGNAWIAVQATTSAIYKVTPTGSFTILTANGATFNGDSSVATGAELTSTFGAAVDGNGNVWFANRCGNYGACGSTAGENSLIEINGTGGAIGTATIPGTVNTAISPSTNYYPEAQYSGTSFTPILYGSLNLAIDPSGNIWITNYTGNSVAEIVGAAAPVATPLSKAAGYNLLGAKPAVY